MSAIDAELTANGAQPGSLKDRLAARRRELGEEHSFVMPVHGYEDLGLHARYKVLQYEEFRAIGNAQRKLEGKPEYDIAIACSTLINSCVELLAQEDDGSFQSLGMGWGVRAAREFFDIELPEQATGRLAMQAIFPGAVGTTNLMLNFRDYDNKMGDLVPSIDEAIREGSEVS